MSRRRDMPASRGGVFTAGNVTALFVHTKINNKSGSGDQMDQIEDGSGRRLCVYKTSQDQSRRRCFSSHAHGGQCLPAGVRRDARRKGHSAHAAGRGGRPFWRAAAAVSRRDMRSLESVTSCICRREHTAGLSDCIHEPRRQVQGKCLGRLSMHILPAGGCADSDAHQQHAERRARLAGPGRIHRQL